MSCKGDTRTQRSGGRVPAEQTGNTAAPSRLALFPPLRTRPATDAEPIRASAAARRGQAERSAAPTRPGNRGQQAPPGSHKRRAASAPLPARHGTAEYSTARPAPARPARPAAPPACPSALAVAPQPISARGAGRAGAGAGRARPWRT